MKNLKLSGLCLLCILFCATASAQGKVPLNEPDYNKPKMFGNLPDQIPVDLSELKNFINSSNAAPGSEVKLRSINNKVAGFGGTIVSSASKFQNTMQSVVVRLDNFNGATLSLSSSVQPDGTVTYTGRIINFKSGDLYELQKINDQYFLIKKNYYELVNE
jgi:hypothetical protein